MKNKFTLVAALVFGAMRIAAADPNVGYVWGHPNGALAVSTAGQTSICGDPIARSVGDLVTIVVDLQNSTVKNQNTTTSKTTDVSGQINSLIYPPDSSNHGWSWYTYHGQTPQINWNSAQDFKGGGSIANTEVTTTTIEARVVSVAPNGVLRVQATRMTKAGEEDTSMILTGLVRPEDLSTANSVSSSRVSDLQILQKGKGTLTADQRKGWLTKLYEFLQPF